jgi:hypothetical protein
MSPFRIIRRLATVCVAVINEARARLFDNSMGTAKPSEIITFRDHRLLSLLRPDQQLSAAQHQQC